jgi:hypothetical protein
MEVYGVEVKFARTVRANAALIEICPEHDINRFVELVKGNAYWLNISRIMEIMQNAYEDKAEFEAAQLGRAYEKHYLTAEQFSYCDVDTLKVLSDECLAAFVGQGKQTVQAKAKPGKKTESQ